MVAPAGFHIKQKDCPGAASESAKVPQNAGTATAILKRPVIENSEVNGEQS